MINAHCQQVFITILSLGYRGLSTQILYCSCPVGRGWTTSQRHCPVQEVSKRRSAGPLVVLQPSALLALFLRPLILEVTIIPFIMVIPLRSSSLPAEGGAIPIPWELRSISFQRERKQRILPCCILGGTKWKKGGGVLGG